jgi:hypothetical protein
MALATLGAAAFVRSQASLVPMDVKPGLWVVIGTTQVAGGTDNSGMTDQQKMAAAMMQRAQQAPHKDEICITKDQGAKPVFQPSDPQNTKCKRTVVKSTADSQDSTYECTGSSAGTGTLHVDRDADEAAHGTGTMTATAMNMSVNYTFTAKWLRAECGKTK